MSKLVEISDTAHKLDITVEAPACIKPLLQKICDKWFHLKIGRFIDQCSYDLLMFCIKEILNHDCERYVHNGHILIQKSMLS